MQAALAAGLLGAALGPGLGLAGCCTGDAQHRAEAGAVARALDVLIAADGEHKVEPLAALAATPCAHEDVCKVKQACVEAFSAQVRGTNLKNGVRDEMRGGGPIDEAALNARLDRAKEELADASRRVPACIEASGKLRIAHKL
jgi:hypothetical protein